MKATHREQVEFLKKRVHLFINTKELWRKFKRRWDLSSKTFQRRLNIAKLELANNTIYPTPAIIFLGMPDGSDINGKKQDKKRTKPTGQKAAKDAEQLSIENKLNNGTFHVGQLEYENDGQNEESPEEKKLRETTTKITRASVFDIDDCLFMLTRMALGQYMVQRQIVSGGRVMDIEEVPSIGMRQSAIIALLKHNIAYNKVKVKAETWCKGERRFITVDSLEEMDNFTDEQRMDIMDFFRGIPQQSPDSSGQQME